MKMLDLPPVEITINSFLGWSELRPFLRDETQSLILEKFFRGGFSLYSKTEATKNAMFEALVAAEDQVELQKPKPEFPLERSALRAVRRYLEG